MRVYGIDFTSRPSRRKPITCLACDLEGKHLRAGTLSEWPNFEDFEAALRQPGPWIAGPVGLMFFEGAPRLRAANVTIPGTQQGDPNRIVIEAYPGILARHLIGRRSYKQDTKAKQTKAQHEARLDLLTAIRNGGIKQTHGISVQAPRSLADDPSADHLDALPCAIQAAWAWTQRTRNYGAANTIDPLEGWIADPLLLSGP